ncbi:MAG: O-antigen ligase family protein [Bacilli bacterium]|nr:O-antigen ligase family protein [Bacilli bacterium]
MKKRRSLEFITNILLLIPFIMLPEYILSGSLRRIFIIYSIAVFGLIHLIYLKKFHFKINKLFILLLFMQLIPIISTIYFKNYDQLFKAIYTMLSTLSIVLLIDYKLKMSPECFLKSFTFYLGVLTIINIISFYLYYPSMSPTEYYFYFLGNDNGSIYETLTFISVGMVYCFYKYSKIPISYIMILVFILIGYLYVYSVNAFICIALVLLFCFIYKNPIFKKICNIKLLVIVYIILFLLIVVFRSDSGLLPMILNFLKRDTTYSGRTFIWDYAFKYIYKYPIIGNGYEGLVLSYLKIHQIKAHNIIIQYLYMGGLSMIYFLLYSIKISLKKSKDNPGNISNLLIYVLFIFLVISLFDYYYSKIGLFVILCLLYESDILNRKKRKEDLNG